jgi:3-oxoacyl-[acyl-carrier-protein] synthase II
MLLHLARGAARRPWDAIAGLGGPLALAASTSKGDVQALERLLRGEAGSFIGALPGQLTPQLAAALGIGAYHGAPVAAACSTGLYALLGAADLVEEGICARALAGAADAALTPLLLAGFSALGVSCGKQHPEAFAERPTGFAPAEGAGFVALAGQGPWRLVGGVRFGDAGHETTFRHPATLATACAELWALLPAPDLIVTHGTGTAHGDAYERHGLDHGPWATAPRLHCKPWIGHCLGASGIIELAIGLESPARRLWKISLGFGGHLAAVAVERAGS